MADNETHVIYKAIADFSALSRAARKAKRDLADLRKEEAKLNAESVAGSAASTVATAKSKKGREALVKQFEAEAGATQKATASVLRNAAATRAAAKEADNASMSVNKLTGEILDQADASDALSEAVKKVAVEHTKLKKNADGSWRVVERNGKAIQENTRQMGAFERAMRSAMNGAGRLNKQLDRLGNWHPRLIPPFIALVPVIGGVLALINPLIAGLGAAGAAGLGFASSLGRVAAGAIGAIPALATLLSVVGALKVAFGGIGGAFKAFSNMKKAAVGGGAGSASQKAELTRTEEITRAQERYARAIQNVSWAQEDLDEARKGYIKRLIDLQKAVDRAAMSEARAAANSQLARENYANVLADPGSTKGQKMEAKVGVDEAQQDFSDVVAENKQNAADLADMKKKGMQGDRQVVQAQRALTDAIWAQRDAQLELINAQNGSNQATSAAATAANEYQEALAKLSPSARRFVENVLSLNDAWTALKRNVQEAFFSEVADDVLRLRDIFPSLEYLLSRTAAALGQLASNFIKLVTSPQWQKDLLIIGDQNVPIIENVGKAILSWVDAFKDLAIIAGPFLTSLTEGMSQGAAEFRDIIGRTRETGELAAYLEKVRTAMAQWWRIIKNVGMTLFNYSAAAGEFGKWLTDGLEKMTESWREASEEARREGSPFQQYLENIKPLLTETKGLFGDFFDWLAKTMMDPENIRIWTEMVGILRDRLGPAIARVLDVLTKSEIGEGLLNSLASIVEFIATFLENGGAEGFKTFYDVVTALFDLLNDFIKLVPPPVLSVLASTFATLAALRFFQVTKISDAFKGFFGFGGGKGGAGGGKGGAAPVVYAEGTRRGPGGGSAKPPRTGFRPRMGGGFVGLLASLGLSLVPEAVGGFFGGGGSDKGTSSPAMGSKGSKGASAGIDVLSSFGKTAKPSAAANAGKGFNLLGSIGKGAGRGAGVGMIASILGTVGGDLISSGAAPGAAGAGQRVGGNTLAGAASGAGIGAAVGSVVPVIGTGIGAAAGGLIGGLIGFFTSAPEDIAAMTEEWGHFFEDVGGWLADVWNGFMNWLTVDLPAWLGDIGEGFMNWLTVDLPGWLADVGEGFWNWLTVDLPYQLGYAAGVAWKWLTVDMPAWFQGVADTVWKWLTVDFPAWVAGIADTVWRWLTVDMPAWVASTAQKFWRWLTVDVPAWIASTAQKFWRWLTVDVPAWIGQAARDFWRWLTVDLPAWIGQAANDFWTWLTVDLPKSIVDAGKKIGDGFTNFFKDFFSGTGKFFAGIGKAWNDFWGGIFGNFGQGFSDGRTGDVPGGHSGSTMKRVQKLLPEGMRISSGYRTAAQNKAAGGSTNSLHMDRNNPAVDIVGSRAQMNAFARLLGAIGGWRQLYYNNINAPGVGHWPGHSDHIHVANRGGTVPGRGNGDTVPSMLTPGEFVVRKAIVSRIGAENLARLNAGIMSYAELLQAAMAQKGKEKQQGGGFGGLEMFGGGGLVPDFGGFGGPDLPPGSGPRDFGDAPGAGGGMSFGDINIYNPAPEPASDSLPRTIRKVAYIGARRS